LPTPAAEPRSIGLASWLGGGSVFVVFLAVGVMAIACAVLLAQLVEQQGLTRAQLAGVAAREQLQRSSEDTLARARALAENPTLPRLLETGPPAGLDFFVRRFCEAVAGDACAVRVDGAIVAQFAPELDWAAIATANAEQGERFLFAPRDGSAPLLGAAIALANRPAAQAVVLRPVAPALLASIGSQVGATLSLVNFATYTGSAEDPLASIHAAALADGRSAVDRIAGDGAFVASTIVATAGGEVIGLLDARVSPDEYAATVKRFNRLLAIAAVLIAGIAGLAGMLYGRWLARPVVALRDAAMRMGQGDFSISMPAVAPTEVGALARTMDDMRRGLFELTDTLRQREAEARAVLGGVVEGVFSVDASRTIRYANPQIARLVGRTPEDIVGRFCGDVLNPRSPDGTRPCETACPIVAARGGLRGSAAEQLALADGTTRSTLVVSAPPVMGLQVQVVRDETDLEAARRARDGVLGNISHEFRTPLAAQLASIELLREGFETLDATRQRELLANVERGVLRLMRLIDNLLESVRIESGQLAIRQQAVDLGEIVDEAAELLRPLLAQRRLTLANELPVDLEAVPGDAQRLVQVFVNLLSNAIKFAPEGSTVRVGGRRSESQVEVWVEDEGPGLPDGGEQAIFERFQRGATTEPDAPGLGLGLWIVRSIAERHGGRVRAGRSSEGRTRFTIELPAQAAA
jgi:signal transduction histidine kinase/heme exporter protein D